VANKSVVHSEMVIEHQETDSESVTNQSPDSLLSNNINVVESKAIDVVKSPISKEKDKANRCLNVIIHNVVESSASEGLTRKEHDLEQVKKNFQQIMPSFIEITKCVCIGRKIDKPNKSHLVKIGVNTEPIKKQILQNFIKLRDKNCPGHMKKSLLLQI